MVSSQTAWVCHSRSNSAHQISSHHQIYEVDRSLLDDLGLQGTGFKLLTNAGPISSSTTLPSFSVAQKRMLLGCVRACVRAGGGRGWSLSSTSYGWISCVHSGPTKFHSPDSRKRPPFSCLVSHPRHARDAGGHARHRLVRAWARQRTGVGALEIHVWTFKHALAATSCILERNHMIVCNDRLTVRVSE